MPHHFSVADKRNVKIRSVSELNVRRFVVQFVPVVTVPILTAVTTISRLKPFGLQ